MIKDVFTDRQKKAFIPYITAGYPDIDTCVELGRRIAESGADILELGIPFSDPLADGPVIQESFTRALEKNITVDVCAEISARIKQETDIPVVFMISYNLVLQKGIESFADLCCSGGVDGVIIPDLPPENAEQEYTVFGDRSIDCIFLVAPNTPHSRREYIFTYTSGFLYCISRMGITGVREGLSEGLDEYLSDIRKHTDLPLCVGFGISRPEHAREVCRYADGVIVGSAIVKQVTELSGSQDRMLDSIGRYVLEMKQAAQEGGT